MLAHTDIVSGLSKYVIGDVGYSRRVTESRFAWGARPRSFSTDAPRAGSGGVTSLKYQV